MVGIFYCNFFYMGDQSEPFHCFLLALLQVWELDTLEPVMTLNDHTNAPMSLLCWDQFLLSCSLDHTIKVWFATGGGNVEAAYTHKEDHVC